jgi:hypothetical protein
MTSELVAEEHELLSSGRFLWKKAKEGNQAVGDNCYEPEENQ